MQLCRIWPCCCQPPPVVAVVLVRWRCCWNAVVISGSVLLAALSLGPGLSRTAQCGPSPATTAMPATQASGHTGKCFCSLFS